MPMSHRNFPPPSLPPLPQVVGVMLSEDVAENDTGSSSPIGENLMIHDRLAG